MRHGYAAVLIRQVTWGLALATHTVVCGSSDAALATEAPRVNEVRWDADGQISATRYETVAIAGIEMNEWLQFKQHRRIGQTFRCPDPKLVAVQFGLDHVDGGYRGLTDRTGKGAPAITVKLRRGGPKGAVVARKIYPYGERTEDLILEVNEDSTPDQTWYVEAEVEHQNITKPEEFTLNAMAGDPYADGQLYLDGRPADGDLLLRVTGAKELSGQREGDFVLWSAYPESRLWIDPKQTVDLMLADPGREGVQLSAARNEWVSTQLTVTPAPGQTIQQAELSVGELAGPDSAVIDAENVTINWMRYSHEVHHKGSLDSGIWYPDPLAPTSVAVIENAPADHWSNVTFWVSIHVSESTPPGEYAGVARITINEGEVLERPIQLTVRDYAIPRETSTHTGLFKFHGGTAEKHRRITEDLASFRIANSASFPITTHDVLRREKFSEGAYRITLGEEMQQSLINTGEIFEAHGLKSLLATPWADTYRLYQTGDPEARKGIIRFWKTYYPILQERGWVDMTYARIVDEIGEEGMKKAKELADLFREHAPGVKIMVTAMGTPDTNELSRAIGIADIWSPSTRYAAKAMDFYQQRLAAGDQVWPYIHPYLFHRSDVAGGRLYFWTLHKYEFPGTTLFNVSPRGSYEQTWFGIERRDDVWPGDGALYYPVKTGASFQDLWRSTRLIRLRDGLEDRECLLMLDRLAAQLEETGKLSTELKEEIAAAKSLPEQLTFGMCNFTHEPGAVQAKRHQLDDVIEKLEGLRQQPAADAVSSRGE